MYRKAGSQSALSGVPSGPYTGGEKRIEASLLSASTRQKIVQALGGRGEPSPIAYERPASLRTTALATWGVILSTIAIPYVFAIGFDNPNSAWARPPIVLLAVFVALGLIFGFSLLAAIRRRVLLGRDALRPGKYLFPLDIVDIALPNAKGEQILSVKPLGDARDAKVEQNGRNTHLVVLFEGGASERFPLRGDPSGDVAFRRLEHAQRLLEELSYAREIERAVSQDLFFEQRADDSWVAVGPASTRKPEQAGARRSRLLAFAFGKLAPVYATLLGLAIGGGVYYERRSLGDQALLNRAIRDGEPAAFDRYIANGGLRRQEAEEWKAAALRVRAELAERQAKEAADRAAAAAAQRESIGGLGTIDIGPRHDSPHACLTTLEAKSSRAHPEVLRIMRATIERLETRNERLIPIVFRRTLKRPANVEELPDDLDSQLDRREKILAWSFERVFSEVCAASVLHFDVMPAGTASFADGATMLDIAYEVTFVKSRTVTAPRKLEIFPFDIVFDVTLRAPRGVSEKAAFRLTMPAPQDLPVTLRPQSLFTADAEPVSWRPLKPGEVDYRVYFAMTARAFDRLYDEVYGLFFAGDPRIPTRAADAFRDAGF